MVKRKNMRNRSELRSNIIINSILVVFCLLMAYPLIYVVSCSFSNPTEVYAGNVVLFPRGFSLASFEKVFQNKNIITGYMNTVFYTTIGTVISLILSFTAAYPLSRKDMAGRSVFMTIFVITMFFSGGLIPLYMVVNTLGLTDTMWGFILPGCLGVWNVIVIRTYISSAIPFELQESAMMDGAGGFKLFFQIVIPLCKPIIAVMILFYIVGYWNSYFNALIFLSDELKYPLQMILRNILIEQDISKMVGGGGGGTQESLFQQAMLSESIKYSSIVVSTIPILCIYPFISKYFEKGLMVGSLKG